MYLMPQDCHSVDSVIPVGPVHYDVAVMSLETVVALGSVIALGSVTAFVTLVALGSVLAVYTVGSVCCPPPPIMLFHELMFFSALR